MRYDEEVRADEMTSGDDESETIHLASHSIQKPKLRLSTSEIEDDSASEFALDFHLILFHMADQDIEALRALLQARPRPAALSERRRRLDDVHSLQHVMTF